MGKTSGFELIEQEGGEGRSKYCYRVFKWKGKIYKMEYSYSRHEGNYMDGAIDSIREVKPIEKTITVYQ